MNILVTAFAYNEISYIPYMVDYYHNQGCELFIIDNFSNDGTYEWLKENNIKTIRVDTNESFHISILQEALLKELIDIQPDWLIYTGIDTFFIFPEKIANIISDIDKEGYNTIRTRLIEVFNTGEEYSLPLHSHYFYGEYREQREMIVKYTPELIINGDGLIIPNKRSLHTKGVLINYGMCKPKEEREETFRRRQRAWKLGLNRGFGTHYYSGKNIQWLWDREKLIDIRTFDEWDMISNQLLQ